jgi:hypothetical protein
VESCQRGRTFARARDFSPRSFAARQQDYSGRVTERRQLSRGIRVIQLVWIAGFLVGVTTHVVDLVLGGADVYAGFHPATRLFWVALTLLDPLTALLIALRNRAGIGLGVLIMLADVAVNWTVFATTDDFGLPGLLSQSLFFAFVLLTARPLRRAFG